MSSSLHSGYVRERGVAASLPRFRRLGLARDSRNACAGGRGIDERPPVRLRLEPAAPRLPESCSHASGGGQERPGLRRAAERRGGEAHRGLPAPQGRRGPAPPSRQSATKRLYVSFFQPSFKLKSKGRDGARQQALPRTPDAKPAVARGPEDSRGRLVRRRTVGDARPNPSAPAEASGAASRRP